MVSLPSPAAGPFRKTSSHQNWLVTLTSYVFLRALRTLSGRQCTDAPSRFRNPLALTRFAPLPRPTLLAGFLTLVSFQMALGAVEGFEESFDGNGGYATESGNLSGLDNPDWAFRTESNVGVLDGNGFLIQIGQGHVGSNSWFRTLDGRGSFREAVRISGLEMGSYSLGFSDGSPRSLVALRHNFPGDGLENALGVYFDPFNVPADNNVIYWQGASFGEKVPRIKDVELGLEYDESNRRVWYWFDSPETGRLFRGPFPVRSLPEPGFTETTLYVGKTLDGIVTGRIDHWSLEPLPDIRADINDDGVLNVADVDLLSLIIRRNGTDAVADLSIDGKVDQKDLGLWVHDHRKTYFGDANLDGQFNSQDLTLVFQAGEYEDVIDDNSGWAVGDWNADGEFSSSDLVVAFQDGGYEQGLTPVVTISVPESSGNWLWLVGLAIAARRSTGSRSSRVRAQEFPLSSKPLACCLAVFFLVQIAQGSNIVGFDESFDGTGPFATISQELNGLDNPNWRFLVEGESGSFDGEGYAFEHKSLPPEGSGWLRNVIGNGSFRQSLKLSRLDMGWTASFPFPPNDTEFAATNLQGMRTQSTLSIIYDPSRPGEEKMLDWWFSTAHGAIRDVVPMSPDVEIGIEQDFECKVAWAWIDSPATGRIVRGPLSFTPYEDNPSFIDVRFAIAATGSFSYISGRLDNWSLESLPDIRADINDDGGLNVADADLLSRIIRRNGTDAVADLSIDGKVDQTDLGLWIHDHRKSYFGDANLDGQFNSQDLMLVFQAGEYEDLIEDNSGWAEGDWNADGEFTSSDLVLAFQDGGYEKGPRAAEGVPEPGGVLWALGGFIVLARGFGREALDFGLEPIA